MWLLSPNFRTQVGDYAGQMATAIGDRLDMRARREAGIVAQGEKSREWEARRAAKTGRGREGARGPSGWRHRRRLERIERMERGGRDLFTEHSAALAHMGISQNAYDEMRRPGADRESVRRNYEGALSALYGYVEDDGLDRKAVARNMRVIVGRLIEHDPDQAEVFSELAHGRFARTEPREVVLPGTDRPVIAWTGDYVDSHSGQVITGGTFALREPMSADEHRVAMARTMYGELTRAKSPAEFSEVLEQYVLGSATRERPETIEAAGFDAVRARLARTRAMFASMHGDGFGDQDQKLVYAGAFVESLEALGRTHSQQVAQWRRGLGPGWERRMHDLIAEHKDLGEQGAGIREQRGVWVRDEPGHDYPSGSEADRVDGRPTGGQRGPEAAGRERPATAPGARARRGRGTGGSTAGRPVLLDRSSPGLQERDGGPEIGF